MSKRCLNDEEKAMYKKALIKFGEELQYQKYLVDHANLMLSKGLKQNFELQCSEYRIKLREANRQIHDLSRQISEYQAHLKDGVPSKEDK